MNILIVNNIPIFYRTGFIDELKNHSNNVEYRVLDQSHKSRNKSLLQKNVKNLGISIRVPVEISSTQTMVLNIFNPLYLLNFDVIFCFGYSYPDHFMLKVWSFFLNRKIVFFIEGEVGDGFRFYKRLLFRKSLLLFSDPRSKVMFDSVFSELFLETHYIGNFLDLRVINEKKKHNGRYVYIGRDSLEKGVNFLENIIAYTKNGLDIYGDIGFSRFGGIYKGFLEREEFVNTLSQYEFLVLPSVHEPYGLVVLEALKCGVKVLCSEHVLAIYDVQNHYKVIKVSMNECNLHYCIFPDKAVDFYTSEKFAMRFLERL